MKKIMILALVSLSGCTTSVSGHPCIGVMEDKIPGVQYELSTNNIVIAVVFSETIIVPVVVAFSAYKCPVK